MDDGSPVLNSSVQFRNRGSGQQFGAQVKESGEFSLPQGQSLPPGTYDVSVSGSSPIGVRTLSATGAKISGRSLEAAPGQDVKLTVVVSKGAGGITGVALKDDKPIDGVMVVLVPELPGVPQLPGKKVDRSAVTPSIDPDPIGVMPSIDRSAVTPSIDPDPIGVMPSIDRSAVMPSIDLFRRDQSDSDGSFNLYGILPGKYTVIAIENGWDFDWFSPGVLQKYLPSGEPVTVSPNSKLNVKVHVVQP